jgi:hypothetical protein
MTLNCACSRLRCSEESELDIIECEGAEAALASMLVRGQA